MKTLKETENEIREGNTSAHALVETYAKTIEKYDKDMHAYITQTLDSAKEKAKYIDNAVTAKKSNSLKHLAGIPGIIKDNISITGVRMTSGSKMLDDYISPYNATVIDRLGDFILLGKGNLDSFAFGSSTENSGYFVSKNPWDISKVAGGSSGGPAAAVAAGMAMFGIGTDTGGSIRQPASLCGLVGLKPTYGRASRYGLAAMGSSLDCPGPITRCVADAAYILHCISGKDEHDATTMDIPVPDYTTFESIKGMKAGLPKEFFDEAFVQGLEPGVKKVILDTVKMLEDLGVEVVDVSMPYSTYALPVYYIITPSEISANMSRYDGIRYGNTTEKPHDVFDMYVSSRAVLEEEVKRRIFVGNYALSSGYYDAYYNKAMQVRTLILQEMKDIFAKVDFIIGPTSPSVAFGVGENMSDPLRMYLEDIFTVTANIAGTPAISIPCGLSHKLPVGFQIMGKQFDEKTILHVAYALEQAIGFAQNYQPNLV